jgi:hypothetical protein
MLMCSPPGNKGQTGPMKTPLRTKCRKAMDHLFVNHQDA